MPFDITAARTEGYTDDEISSFLSESFDVSGALSEGYTLDEISSFINKPAPEVEEPEEPGFIERAVDFAGRVVEKGKEVVSGLFQEGAAQPDPSLTPTEVPSPEAEFQALPIQQETITQEESKTLTDFLLEAGNEKLLLKLSRISPEINNSLFGELPGVQPEVPSTVSTQAEQPVISEAPEFAPSRALGQEFVIGEDTAPDLAGIPTRKPLPETPLAATAAGIAESIPFIGPEGADVERLKELFPGSTTIGQIGGTIAQIIAGGGATSVALAKTALTKSPVLMATLVRAIPAIALRGAQTAEQVKQGKIDVSDGLFNTIVESGGGAAFSMIPEITFSPGVAQLIVQPLADIVYQAGVDLARGRGEDVLGPEWFKEQIPTIAASLGFAIKDVASGSKFKATQGKQRAEIKGWLKGKGDAGFEIITTPEGIQVLGKKGLENIDNIIKAETERFEAEDRVERPTQVIKTDEVKEFKPEKAPTGAEVKKPAEPFKPSEEELAKLPDAEKPPESTVKPSEEIDAPKDVEGKEVPISKGTEAEKQDLGFESKILEERFLGGRNEKPVFTEDFSKLSDSEKFNALKQEKKSIDNEIAKMKEENVTTGFAALEILKKRLTGEQGKFSAATEVKARREQSQIDKFAESGKADTKLTQQIEEDIKVVFDEFEGKDITQLNNILKGDYTEKQLTTAIEAIKKGNKNGKAAQDIRKEVGEFLQKGFTTPEQVVDLATGKGPKPGLKEAVTDFKQPDQSLGTKQIEDDVFFDEPTPTGKKEKVFFAPERAPIESHNEPRDPITPDTPIRHQLPKSMTDKIQGKGKPAAAHKIIKKMSDAAIAPIRIGRFRQKAVGIFKVDPEVIRIKVANDIPTAAHETAHAINKQLRPLLKSELGLQKKWNRVRKDLLNLGKQLYGSRKPEGGYASEGFAEYIRYKLTTEEASARAPRFDRFFEEEILSKSPELKAALEDIRKDVTTFRQQGAKKRVESQIAFEKVGPGFIQKVRNFFSAKNTFEEFDPLYKFDKVVTETIGRELKTHESPFLSASALKLTHDSKTRFMVEDGMLDWLGNKVGPSLREATAPVLGKQKEFTSYLYARRALERIGKRKNPGITKADAEEIIRTTETPEFQIAAHKVYEWNKGVLNYVAQADPSLKPIINKIFAGSTDYVPLARVFDDVDQATARRIGARSSQSLFRMRGSGRRIRDPFQAMVENAEKLIKQSHQRYVTRQLLRWKDIQGIGHMIEEVPKDLVPKGIHTEEIIKKLEQSGAKIDLDDAELEDMITFFTPEVTPKGKDPIIPIRDDTGEIKWYQMDGELYNTLQGMEVWRLPKVLDFMFGAPTRMFKLGTTGARPVFSFIRNPLRDIQSLLFQTHSKKGPIKIVSDWARFQGELIGRTPLGLERNPYHDLFKRLGGEMSQPLGIDTRHTRRAVKELFQGKIVRIIKQPLEHLRDVLQIPETATRLVEVKAIAEEVGWKPGTPITLEQSMEILLKSKRVTTDFGAAGKITKIINQAVPFFGANIQGPRTFLRTLKRNPTLAAFKGVAMFTIPTLLLWWQNKDKKWYKDMTWRDKFGYWNIESEDEVVRIPRAFDIGNMFSVLPEAIVDSWYREDPETVKQALGHVLETSIPDITPQTVKPIAEQLANKQFFSGRPIAHRGIKDIPYEEQYGPYTSELAKFLGEKMEWSPVRIDHLIRGYGGGLAMDIVNAVPGLGSAGVRREREPSDIPIVGTLFRRGGKYGRSQAVEDMYDQYGKAKRLFNSRDLSKKYDPQKLTEYHFLKAAVTTIRVYYDLINLNESRELQNEMRSNIQKTAEDALSNVENFKIESPEQ